MKVAVTGGAGFIGSNLTNKLIELGYDVVIIDDLSTGDVNKINPKAIFVNESLHTVDVDVLASHLSGCEIVFHLAALARVQPSIIEPLKFNDVNVKGTLNVLFASHKAGVRRLVYSASSSCYGDATIFPTSEDHPINPLSPYGLQKHIGELYCKMFSQVYGLDTVSLRYFNVYGEGMNTEGAYKLVIAVFADQLRRKQPLTINNDGRQRRDFTYVGDIVDLNILAGTHTNALMGESFNAGSGKNYSVNELADMFGGDRVYIGDVLEPFQTLANNSKARSVLGWNPKGDLKQWMISYIKTIQ